MLFANVNKLAYGLDQGTEFSHVRSFGIGMSSRDKNVAHAIYFWFIELSTIEDKGKQLIIIHFRRSEIKFLRDNSMLLQLLGARARNSYGTTMVLTEGRRKKVRKAPIIKPLRGNNWLK